MKNKEIEELRYNNAVLRQEIRDCRIKEAVSGWKYWLIEDGSVDVDELQKFIEEKHLRIKIIIYRQGSKPPELKSF